MIIVISWLFLLIILIIVISWLFLLIISDFSVIILIILLLTSRPFVNCVGRVAYSLVGCRVRRVGRPRLLAEERSEAERIDYF